MHWATRLPNIDLTIRFQYAVNKTSNMRRTQKKPPRTVPGRSQAQDELKDKAPATLPDPAHTKWYLGFDCATKTLGFGLMSISLEHYQLHRERLWGTALKMVRGELTAAEISQLDRETAALIVPIDGEVVDLFPGRPDKSIHTIERIRALKKYVTNRIAPSIEKNVPPKEGNKFHLKVPVEFQMGPNARARTIAASLITQFDSYDVFLVGPSLKNKVHFTEEGKYAHFVAKYNTLYTASKAHTKFNFVWLENIFGTQIPPTKPASNRGHIADAIMQVFGHILYGLQEGEHSLAF